MKRVTIAAVLILAACQSGVVPETTTTTTTTTPTTTATSVPEAGGQTAIYVMFEGYPVAPGPFLAAVSRPGANDLEDALSALLEGVTAGEAGMGLSSAIPVGTRLLRVEVAEGVASVDLSREFDSGGGSLSMMARVTQVVYTATRFAGVDAVRFLIDGSPLEVLGGEGLIIDGPQTRDDWSGLTPPILVETPPWGSTVGHRIEIAGSAELESGSLSYAVVDADGLIIDEGDMSTTPGLRSSFSTIVNLDEIPHPGIGSVILWEWAPGGSQRHVVEYPLTLQGP